MIAQVRGTVLQRTAAGIVIDLHGLGLQLACTPRALAAATVGTAVTLQTSLVVREDHWQLFGFNDAAERDAFELLQSVTGIGPRIALAAVSTLEPERIAQAIVARREAGQLPDSTLAMAALVAEVVKTREPGQHPATRTFQAFRIFINHELDELQQALQASLSVLETGGRLVVISFHSLEDRMVKQFMTRHARQTYDRRTPFAPTVALPLRTLGKVKPSADEVRHNPRSRSAIMRVAERLAHAQEVA